MKGREHMVRNEIVVLKRVSQGHKNILTLVDYFETFNNLYLVTDLALGGELFDRICSKGSYYESDAVQIVRAVTDGVAYLHRHGIVHRDLKAENVLFKSPHDDSDVLIADFGLSRIVDEEQLRMLTTTCGTPGYMAPEIFNKTGHGKPVDVWAIGVITYFLLCGYTPFDRDSSADEMRAILSGDFRFEPDEFWAGVSENARDFIRETLRVDYSQRITAENALAHPFLRVVSPTSHQEHDLLPNVQRNLSRSKATAPALDLERARAFFETNVGMDGAFSQSPETAKRPGPV